MSVPISARMTVAESALTPGMVASRAAASRKGSRRSPSSASISAMAASMASAWPRWIRSSRRGGTLVVRHPAPEGLDDLGAGGADAGPNPTREAFGVGLPLGQRVEDRPPAGAHDVGQDRAELEVGGLQELVDALDVRGLLAGELLAGAGELPQRLDRHRRDENLAGPAQRQQTRPPRRHLRRRSAGRPVT